MSEFVSFKTIAPKGYSYFKDKEKFNELDEFLEESAGFFINHYRHNKYLFYYDNDTSTNLIFWFVYFKKKIMFDLDFTIVINADFNPKTLNETEKKVYDYICSSCKKIVLPIEYVGNPYDFLNKQSFSISVVEVNDNKMTRYREK